MKFSHQMTSHLSAHFVMEGFISLNYQVGTQMLILQYNNVLQLCC